MSPNPDAARGTGEELPDHRPAGRPDNQPDNRQDRPRERPQDKPPELAPSMRTIAMPADTNPNGDIFGGWLLAQMDLAGGTYAFHAAGGRVATVAITGMQFHKPVYVGDEVSCYCDTARIGTTSIAVRVETWVRRRSLQGLEKVTEGLFTFVALDEHGQPRAVRSAHDGAEE